MLAGERFIEEIAYALQKDPLDIRKANFYGQPGDGRTRGPGARPQTRKSV